MALIEIDGVYRSFCSMVDLSSSLALFVRFPDDPMNPQSTSPDPFFQIPTW